MVLPFVNRILGPDQMGLYSLVDNLAQYFIMFAALGIPIYGVREISKTKRFSEGNISKVFSELLTINLILTLFALIIYLLFFLFNDRIHYNFYIYILGGIQIISSVFSLEWFFQGIENFKFIALRNLIVRLISIAAIFLLVKDSNDGGIYYTITTSTFVITSIWNISYLIKHIRYSCPKRMDVLRHARPLITFFTTKFMISVYVTFTIILLGFLSTQEDVAYFGLAFKIFNIIVVLVSSLTTVAIARTSVDVLHDIDKFNITVRSITDFNVLAGLPASVLVFLYAEELVFLLGGSAFQPAVYSLKILSLLILIIPFSNLFALNILTPLKKERHFLYSTMVGTVISLILNFILIPRLGYRGATVAFLATELIVFICLFIFVKKNYIFTVSLKGIGRAGALALFFIPVYYWLAEYEPLWKLIFGTTASVLIYAFGQYVIFRNEQIAKLVGLFVKIYSR